MKHTIELEYKQIDAIVADALESQFLSLKEDLSRRLSDDYTGAGFFDKDKDADCAEIQSHMDAIAKVLSYNMVFDDYENWKSDDPCLLEKSSVSDEDYCITEQAAEIERFRAALQLIAADVTGNKHHQAQFRQDTACEALETLDERTN